MADNRADPRKRPEWDRFAPFANELFPFTRTRIYVSIRTGGLLTDYRRKRISDGHTPRRVREFGESFSVTDTANVDRVKRARPIRKSKNETPIPRRAVVVAPDACYYLGAGPRESGTPYGRTRRHKNGLIRSAWTIRRANAFREIRTNRLVHVPGLRAERNVAIVPMVGQSITQRWRNTSCRDTNDRIPAVRAGTG